MGWGRIESNCELATERNQCAFIPKNNGVEIKRIFYDACRRRSGPEDVLFGGQIVRSSYSLQVAKIAATNISMQHAANNKDTDQLM